MGKHDHLRERVRELLLESKTVVEICSLTGIPGGSIHYLLERWGFLDLQVRKTKRYSEKTLRTWGDTFRQVHSSGKTSGNNHFRHGKRKVRGVWVSSEECRQELEIYVRQDLTIAEMDEAMGTWRAKTWLREFGLQQGIRSGSRCSWYRGGWRKERGPDWLEVRDRILERDGYRCTSCGLTQEEARERGHTLSIHHLVPWEETHDNSDSNLVTLCQSCHMKEEWRTGRWRNNKVS